MALPVSQAFLAWRRCTSAALVLLPALLAPALSGCGQKGPLVLPPSAAASAPAASTPPSAPAR